VRRVHHQQGGLSAQIEVRVVLEGGYSSVSEYCGGVS
jgi:hypothetical protein